MTPKRTAGRCLCGQIEIVVTGKPAFSVLCYCRDCQQISGAGGFPQAAFAKDCVELTGTPKTYSWRSDAGNELQICHCPRLWFTDLQATSKMADMRFVAVGLLDDQTLFQAPHPAFAQNRPGWDKPD